MGMLWNVTKTPIINKSTGFRSSTGSVRYNIKLTTFGTIVLFPIWFPLFVLFFVFTLFLVIIKAIRG